MIRVNICTCITDSLCCTPETNNILLINYTPINFFKKIKKIKNKIALKRIKFGGINLTKVVKELYS